MSAQSTPLERMVVIYRIGGTMMCRWHRVLDTFANEAEAGKKVAELEKAGYLAICAPWQSYINNGMPIGWQPGQVDWDRDHMSYVINEHGHTIETRWTSHQLHS